ncbi:MAG: LytTR family transcriptional regulator DNA-binding domain-containing protein [Oscillospiraceae bacterium]|nr:LytTR family transcriptional regulator DNA-binding domain-containing protein [Oscillospiraceae bacterium]
MNKQEIAALSAELILRYYDNDVAPFLAHLDDDVLWYGPAEGQFLQGRETMLAAWAGEDNSLTFTMGNLKTKTVSSGSSLCVVVLTFSVVTHYPSGNDLPVNQRVALTWCERKKVPRILCCDITNPHRKSAEDSIYFVHFEQVLSDLPTTPYLGERLRFRGMGSTEYYLYSNSILWGDSCGNGQRCLLHLTDGSEAEVTMSVRDIAAAYPSLFLRCHASHFVNPIHVTSLRRFAVTLMGGAELPVPEKSYTAFKRALNAFV